ncbi:Carboxypeptidase D [Fasciola gigantica]|uniref:Carboxypeptidase D n=1 Tax=Fasciola gigantica TaxID=46835 RepID=A0A504Z510_FASGI|nr:Carboxypeptidase D [Fasciola gigantica]
MISVSAPPGDRDGNVGRSNKHDVDLNRDFPDQFKKSLWERFKEPETIALMNWSQQYPFVLSGSIHGGALVAVYPFDGSPNKTAYHARTPDDAVFHHLATLYSQTHKRMHSGSAHCDPKAFPDGVSNGNAWYPLFGGMQDWNYLHTGCMEITLELSCDKYPRAEHLVDYWNENKYPLIRFVAEVHRALKGFVIDGSSGLPLGNASIHVLGNSHIVYTTAGFGDYWRLLPPDGHVTLWASKSSYFDSDKVTIDAAQLPFVAQTKREQLNFTLWPSTTEDWSEEIDFGIQLNRRPAYFPQNSVTSAVRSVVFGDFARLFRLGSDGPASNVLGVEMTIVAHGLKRGPARSKVKLANVVHPLPGRSRIILLAGLHAHDLVSTDMLIRMIRHYIVGLNMLDRHVSHLLSSQLVVLPYLDRVGISQTATLVNSPLNLSDSVPGVCLVHGLSSDNSPESIQSIWEPLKDLIYSFKPHLIVALTAGPVTPVTWNVSGTSFSAPISPVYVPRVFAAGVSLWDLAGDIAYEFADQFGMLNRSESLCGVQTTSEPQNESTSWSRTQKKLTDLLSFMYTERPPNDTELPPLAVAVHLSCEACSVPSPQSLPELWHRTLSGLTAMFHAVRNLSFRGRLLIETGPLTLNRSGSLPLYESGWTSVPTARILVQPAFFLPSQSNMPNHTLFVSVSVDPQSGLFCALLPSGTYLAFASADAEDTVLGKAYEEVALAVSLNSDQNNGRIQIRLQKQVSKIEFHSPDDMTKRLQKLSEGSSESRCGHLHSIGRSTRGNDLYVFEMGINRTVLQRNPTRTTSEENEGFEQLLPADENALNGTEWFASLSPKVILFGNLDGSDLVSPQLMTHFIEWLCSHRDNESAVTQLLSTVQLAVISVPNPDGLSTAWENTFDQGRLDLTDEEVCLSSGRSDHSEFSRQFSPKVTLENERMRLWNELIDLTKARTLNPHRWWWETSHAANLSVPLSPEIKSIVSWLRTFQPNVILSLPSGAPSPSIDYGLDLMETDVAQEWNSETYKWLRFLGHLLAPGFHRYSTMCAGKEYSGVLHTRSSPSQRGHLSRDYLVPNTLTVGSRSGQWDSAQTMPLALSLASMSPDLALDELTNHQLQHSRSFPPPLPLTSPISLALTLCPACRAASPRGIARVWSDFRLPSLLLGLLGHASLTAQGSSGLIGQVVSTTGSSVPWVRVHVDFMRSEASTGSSSHQGYFSLSLPPGTYDLSFRAQGFLDHSETVKIGALHGPVRHVFSLQPVSALSLNTRIYMLSIAGSLAAICLCLATTWLCYRFCCRARTPYAMARRAFGLRFGSSKSININQSIEPNRGAYRLIPVNQSGESDPIKDETCRAMLSDHEDENDSDVGSVHDNLSVRIASGTNGGAETLEKRLHSRLPKSKKNRASGKHWKKSGHTRIMDDDDELEEVDLV